MFCELDDDYAGSLFMIVISDLIQSFAVAVAVSLLSNLVFVQYLESVSYNIYNNIIIVNRFCSSNPRCAKTGAHCSSVSVSTVSSIESVYSKH
jgi:hypothetical protein